MQFASSLFFFAVVGAALPHDFVPQDDGCIVAKSTKTVQPHGRDNGDTTLPSSTSSGWAIPSDFSFPTVPSGWTFSSDFSIPPIPSTWMFPSGFSIPPIPSDFSIPSEWTHPTASSDHSQASEKATGTTSVMAVITPLPSGKLAVDAVGSPASGGWSIPSDFSIPAIASGWMIPSDFSIPAIPSDWVPPSGFSIPPIPSDFSLPSEWVHPTVITPAAGSGGASVNTRGKMSASVATASAASVASAVSQVSTAPAGSTTSSTHVPVSGNVAVDAMESISGGNSASTVDLSTLQRNSYITIGLLGGALVLLVAVVIAGIQSQRRIKGYVPIGTERMAGRDAQY